MENAIVYWARKYVTELIKLKTGVSLLSAKYVLHNKKSLVAKRKLAGASINNVVIEKLLSTKREKAEQGVQNKKNAYKQIIIFIDP